MRALSLAFVALVVAACEGTTADAGLHAALRADGAQFFQGAMPADTAGPKVAAVNLVTTAIRAGSVGKSCSGALAAEATAAAIALAGDDGYWVVTASVPDIQTPGLPSFRTKLSFSSALSPGAHDLVVRAVDVNGHFGPANVQPLTAMDPTPQGRVVVSLTWDSESDLDLRVVDPNGAEVWKRNINSFGPPVPGQPPGSDAWKNGGILDFDSNAACLIDGRRRENVVWKTTAPSGHYLVRVDTFSLCNEVSANWKIEAFLSGASLGSAQGSSFDSDTRLPHDRGAGLLALEFDVP
jgi:hypothetical protein